MDVGLRERGGTEYFIEVFRAAGGGVAEDAEGGDAVVGEGLSVRRGFCGKDCSWGCV